MKAKHRKKVRKSKSRKRTGKGLVNSLINNLPFELHAPGYQYLGPGTKLKKRIKRNDPGINELDRAAKEHDIAYSRSNKMSERHHADKILGKKAWGRVKSRDASLGERALALGVTGIMKAKRTLGMGLRKKSGKKKKKIKMKKKKKKTKKRKTSKKKKKTVAVKKAFQKAMKEAKSEIAKKRPQTVPSAAEVALDAAKAAIKDHKIPKGKLQSGLPRVIPVPKIGGVLPLIPIFAGLSALGALMGGSASVANAVVSANNAKKNFKEAQRHNQSMEAIAIGRNAKTGSGLYLMPYKKGFGLYLAPISKNV